MPCCSICNNVYSEVKSLMTHLKLFHGVQEMSVFKCAESDCTRDFSSAASFKKHLKTHTFNVSNIKSNFKQETDNLKLPVNQNVDKNICEPENLDTFEKDSSSEFNKFKITLRNKADSVITKLYGDSTLNRKLVQTVIDSVLDLICEPMDLFKQDLLRILGNAEVDNTKKGLVNDYFFEWDSVFMDLTSDYLRQKYLEKLGLYIKSIEYVTGERFDLLQNDVLKAKAYSAQFVPISPILKLFLELPCVFPEIIKYINDLKCSSNISNIIQTDFWKNKLKHFQQSDLVLPLFLYFDEFEIGNPLGSHAGIHKIGAIYWSIPCIPPNYRAHLENIFLVLLFHSSDLKEFGSNAIFLKLVEELTNIQENGIVIVSDQDKIKIKVSLTLCLGDNLGLNTLLGFTESFRANFFCRFCKSHRTQTQEIVLPNHNLIRDKANYETDIQENNASSTGIKEACVFNKIPNFHVTENFCVDLAHDIFEGVALFDIVELLYHFVLEEKLFNIDDVNLSLKCFNFGNKVNKPPLITLENLKKRKMNMSFSEMKCFVLYFGLLFGTFVPEQNRFWKVYILLREILEIVLATESSEGASKILENVIKEHHELYKNLFQKPLKPKHHILLHYPYIIQKVGPVINLSTLRFESKHKEFKVSANVVSSRVNITQTLATKNQLKLCHRFKEKKGFCSDIYFNKKNSSFGHIHALPEFHNIDFENIIVEDFQQVYLCNQVNLGHLTYKLQDL